LNEISVFHGREKGAAKPPYSMTQHMQYAWVKRSDGNERTLISSSNSGGMVVAAGVYIAEAWGGHLTRAPAAGCRQTG